MVNMFGLFAEIEWDLILRADKTVLDFSKEKKVNNQADQAGQMAGKSKLDKHKIEIEALLKNGSTKGSVQINCHFMHLRFRPYLSDLRL